MHSFLCSNHRDSNLEVRALKASHVQVTPAGAGPRLTTRTGSPIAAAVMARKNSVIAWNIRRCFSKPRQRPLMDELPVGYRPEPVVAFMSQGSLIARTPVHLFLAREPFRVSGCRVSPAAQRATSCSMRRTRVSGFFAVCTLQRIA